MKATIDTGATRSFMSEYLSFSLIGYGKISHTQTQVRMADGSKCQVVRSLDLEIIFGNESCLLNFMILPRALDEVVLGLDFLMKMNCVITCAGQQLELRSLPTINRFEETRCNIVVPEVSEDEKHISVFLKEELSQLENVADVSNITQHKIIMKDDRPVKQRYFPRNPAMQKIIHEQVQDLLEKGCIEPSHSPHSAPIVLVRKKNDTWRLCIDFRQLNDRSVPDAYPLPRINHILERLRNAKYISCLDLKNGYWQIPMEPDSKKYTAFTVPGMGLFQWKVMPFGLHSAPATFQRALDSVIGADMEPHAFAYLDDIIVIGRSLEEHMKNLKEVFRRLKAANLKINIEKCDFFKKELKYLGHIVSEEGILTDPEKISAIQELKAPTNVRELRRCLGMASWYRRFVPDFAKIVEPLTSLLKKGKHFRWLDIQEIAFQELKKRLTEAPVLTCPDFNSRFFLQTDASDYGLGALLTQEIDGVEKVIAYASRHLNQAEKNYSATEKECLAIIWAIRKMKQYVEGYEFTVVTDHLALKWMNSIENPSGRIARWALELQQYKFDVKYRRGKLNVVADALSRQPVENPIEVAAILRTDTEDCSWFDNKIRNVRENPGTYPDYSIVGKQLYRRIGNQTGDIDVDTWKLCVPSYLRQRVLRENHDTPTAGHLRIRKTIARITAKYYWPGIYLSVRQYVRKCESCQRYKVEQQKPAGEMLTKISQEPWEIVCTDFVGPLPRSKHGHNMLLVFHDKFSKWVELVPLRKATAETLIKGFRESILARFGVPKMLVTDNGVQFASKIFRQFLTDLGVQQQFTAPYTPRENPTERANRTIKTIIAQLCENNHKLWDEKLPEISLAINTGVAESTGFSPAFLIQGREPRLPAALFDETAAGKGHLTKTANERKEMLQDTFKIVRNNLEKAAAEQAKHYNLRRRIWKPLIGDLVLVRQHHLSKAADDFAAKLAPKYDGPYIVTGFKSPGIVELILKGGKDVKIAPLSELKKYSN